MTTHQTEADAASGSSPDSLLLARLRAGEDKAYEELVRLYGGRLFAVANRIVRNEADAQDCVQESFLNAFRSLDRFEGKARLSTWLHRIVVNASLMKLRSKKRKPEDLLDPQLPELDRYGFRVGPTEADWASADELLERHEVRDQVRAAIDRLPETHRIVLVLRDIEELDTTETAALLGLSPGAVKTRLHRARLALRERIGSLSE